MKRKEIQNLQKELFTKLEAMRTKIDTTKYSGSFSFVTPEMCFSGVFSPSHFSCRRIIQKHKLLKTKTI